MKKFKYLILMFCCTIIVSCDTDEPPFPSQNNQDKDEGDSNSNSDNSNASNDNNASNNKYYFELEKPMEREIGTEAGSIKIFFKCNQEYVISATGNVTGLSLSHTYGEGDGFVIVSYDKVKYKEGASGTSWNERCSIVFTVKDGSKSNFKVIQKSFFLFRQGFKVKF